MTPFNKVIMVGRLVADPEMKMTANNKERTTFTIAVRRAFKNASGTYDSDFITCETYGSTAKLVSNYFSKGSEILVDGQWHTGSFTNKEGNKVYTNILNVNSIVFGDKPSTTAPAARGETAQAENMSVPIGDLSGFEEVDVGDNLPF